ncbi:MAG: UvrD-helicase domain-containing protein [Candidatus Melainabacteria bacterium]|nr:UvrD-helicase domain-containing protein [Candidatus Melainabacteria bacterium]
MAKRRRPDLKSSRVPPQPTDCRDAMHWFVDNYGLYTGSVRGLFASDCGAEQEAYLEAAMINLRSRGIEPFIITGEQVYAQADLVWQNALAQSRFGQPTVSNVELDYLASEVAVLKDLEAPTLGHHMWYLYHYLLYPRVLYGKATVLTTPLGLDEFLAYGARCDDNDYAGRKVTWDKLMWLVDSSLIDLYHFRQVRADGLPPMLVSEYHLFNGLKERDLPVVAQQVLGDYVLDLAIADRDNRLDIECDTLASIDAAGFSGPENKKNLVLLSDGWKILRFTTSEIMSDLPACVDAVEQVWKQGRKKSTVGRLLFGRGQTVVPELPVDDDEQKQAITHGAGPVAVTGGAGTGKTSCVAHRVGYLLAQGVSPERILVFSSTEASVARLQRMVEVITDAQTVQKLNFSHWTDIGFRILKENAVEIGRKPPLKLESNPARLLSRVLKKVRKDVDPVMLELIDDGMDEDSLASLISLYKANLVTARHVEEGGQTEEDKLVGKVYSGYEEQLKKSNRVDPDDTIMLAGQLLADDVDVRYEYESKYDFVLIDEYQECTAAQDLLAKMLSFPQDNLFLAGNEDECLTAGRGAMPNLLAETSIRMPNARCYILQKNWRSHPAIVNCGKLVVQSMAFRMIAKDVQPASTQKGRSAIIGPHESRSEKEESDWVANEVSILLESGKQPGDIVLCYRDPRYASIIEAALFRKNIQCAATGPVSDAVPDEVGDVMAFLRLVMDPDGPKARESFERICQLRSRDLDQKLSKLSTTIASFAEANNLSFLKAIEIYYEATKDPSCKDLDDLVRIVRTMNQESLPPAETISILKRTQKLQDIYKSAKIPSGVVYKPLEKVEQMEEEARGYKSIREFIKAKENLSSPGKVDDGGTAVSIKGIEDLKGEEYPVVFLTGVSQGLFPADDCPDVEEERRLFYVAISRAKELLYVSHPRKFEEKLLIPSPFLVEAELLSTKAFQKAVQARQEEASRAPEETQQPSELSGTELLRLDAEQLAQQQQAELRAQEEAQLRAQQKAQEEAQLRAQEEAQLRAQQKAQEEAQLRAQQKAQEEAQLRAQEEAQLRAQQKAQEEAQLRAQEEAQLRAQQKAQEEAQLRAQEEAQLRAQQKAQEEAQLRAQEEAQLRAQQKAQEEAELRAQEEARQRAQQKAQEEAQQRAQQEAEQKAQQEAILKVQQEASRAAQAESLSRDQEERIQRSRREAQLRALWEIDPAAASELEMKLKQEDDARARDASELQVQQEAEHRAQQESQLRSRHEDRLRSEREAEVKAQQDAHLQIMRQAELLSEQSSKNASRSLKSLEEELAAMTRVDGTTSEIIKEEVFDTERGDFVAGDRESPVVNEPAQAVEPETRRKERSEDEQAERQSRAREKLKERAKRKQARQEASQSSKEPLVVPEKKIAAPPRMPDIVWEAEPEPVAEPVSEPVSMPEPAPEPVFEPEVELASLPEPASEPVLEPRADQPVQDGESDVLGGGTQGVTLHGSGRGANSFVAPPDPSIFNVQRRQEQTASDSSGKADLPAPDPAPPSFSGASQLPPPIVPAGQPLVLEGSTIPYCPHCMIQLEAGARFCGECGYQMEVRIPACPGCALPVEPGAKFCGECGFALKQAQ